MSLAELGLTADEERVYRALLAEGWTDIPTLAAATTLPETHLQNCLDALVERSLIAIAGQDVQIPDPRVALGNLLERVEDEVMARYRRLSAMRSDIALMHAAAAPTPRPQVGDIERIEGLEAVRVQLAELAFFARTSVMAVHPGGPQSAASIEASRPLDRRAVRRGMRVRVIHDRRVLGDELNRAYLHELTTLGVQARVADTVPERVVIFDESVAVVPAVPGKSGAGALVVRHPGLVVGLVDLFERAWIAAEDISWDPGVDAAPAADMEERDRRLLVLLASGCTDESAAREFGISVRHLRRQVARLMADLGARSRFEAGAEATRRGWL